MKGGEGEGGHRLGHSTEGEVGGGKRRGVDRRTDTGSCTELVAAGPA